MREIKFRYTVKRDNGYVFSGIFTLEEIERGAVFAWANANLVDIEQVTKEQFTGLRDKNGREIYEGDIVQTFMFGKKVVGIIKYSGKWGSFYFGTKNDYGVGIAFKDVFEWCYDDEDDEGEILSEIIGNIHKNPELKEEI